MELITLIMIVFHIYVPVSRSSASMQVATGSPEWNTATINVISSFTSHTLVYSVFRQLDNPIKACPTVVTEK